MAALPLPPPESTRPAPLKLSLAWSLPLTQGFVTLLDEEDYEWARQWKWCVRIGGSPVPYAGRARWVDGKRMIVRLHRELMRPGPGEEVDHVNGDTLDNRRANLRLASHLENMRNQRIRGDNTSGFKGVSWHRRDQRWRAVLRYGGRQLFLGYFVRPENAARAYDAAARSLFGDFARLNLRKPPEDAAAQGVPGGG